MDSHHPQGLLLILAVSGLEEMGLSSNLGFAFAVALD
jgi:hypothetical protein